MSRFPEALALAALVFALGSCGGAAPTPVAAPDPRLVDESRPAAERIAFMESLQRPLGRDVIEGLLTVMKDRSQQAFIMVPDDSSLGWHVAESPYDGPDRRAELRWCAVETVERLEIHEALPDLVSALWDRHPVVRNLAARALWRFGSEAGLDVLLKGLEGRALENETADAVLREITGRDAGFDTDAGWARKSAAIERWREIVAEELRGRARLPEKGARPALDRRIRFWVDVLGQHQFLFMEQARRNLGLLGDLAAAHIEEAMVSGPRRGSQQLRAYGVQALAEIGTARAQRRLRTLLESDPDGAVRARAAKALGDLGGDEARAALRRALADGDEGVVIAAVGALGRLGDPEGAELLEDLMKASGSSERLRREAACALLRLGRGASGARELVLGELRDGPLHVRAELAEFLDDWLGERFGFDVERPGREQEAALQGIARALR